MNVEANDVIAKLAEQNKQLSLQIAIKDCQIETLMKELAELKESQK